MTSAVIGTTGGGTEIGKNSTIIEDDRFLICCSDSVFCLSIPDLALLWRRQADEATCFEIFKYQDSYIVHCELNISRLNKNGEVLWQQSGADIFTTLDGKNDFIITENYILATDWENRQYKFDFNGTELQISKNDQVRNWLTIGFLQTTDKISEVFYFDKKNNEFFSILITDYFLFDDDLNLAKDTTTTYSEETLKILIDRIKRIENKDKTIIPLPRLENHENGNDIDYISLKIDKFLKSNLIIIDTVTIWETEEDVNIIINLKEEMNINKEKPWWKLWK